MHDIFLERNFADPITIADVQRMGLEEFNCQQIYSVEWQESFLAVDGSRMYCHFKAPDSEALRNVMRFSKSDYKALWRCEIHQKAAREAVANVLVEHAWTDAGKYAASSERELQGNPEFDQQKIIPVRTFYSGDRMRMICLYNASDAETVRKSRLNSGIDCESAWTCQHLTPASMMPG